ncbi:hypothetical protein ACES2I_08695 [Bdellovibrio bacteriovorus]|uniref:hypothetical protein n=1 Tax=Bdellovibrio bacteriovorus TaxID=959 RepID=UPI0035A586EB
MIEERLKTIKTCLYVASGIHLTAALKASYDIYQLTSYPDIGQMPLSSGLIGSLVFGLVFPLLFAVGAVKTVQGLKEQNPYFWISGIFLGAFSLFSWAAPAGVIVLMLLLDKRVREPFIKKLDLQY